MAPRTAERVGWRLSLPKRRRGWVWLVMALGAVLNGLRLRRRLSGLDQVDLGEVAASATDEVDDFVLLRAVDVTVDASTRAAAKRHADVAGLDVVDLVPKDLPPDQVLDLARRINTRTYRSSPLAAGGSALHAILVRREVWDRIRSGSEDVGSEESAASGDPASVDQADLARLAKRLKQYAARTTDLAVVAHLQAKPSPPDERLGVLEAVYNEALPAALAVPVARSSLLAAGLVLSPGWAAAALASWCLQPYLVAAGTPLRPLGGVRGAIRSLVDPFAVLRAAVLARGAAPSDSASTSRNVAGGVADPVEALRPLYAELMADGIDRFMERRRDTCPLCDGPDLEERLRIPDWIQFKPGEFVLDRCRRCGHVFQNPRLSAAGLDFYYRDVYDGLGADNVDFLFRMAVDSYRGRVDMVRRYVTPESWLDVGSGHGHFCLDARSSLPDTRFDGLDMGESIDEAERRRWVDRGYRGMFPDLAGQLAGRYDVVSMHHYLEHTLDPWAELDAAWRVLPPGGHLLIEVPDPESRFAQVLGRYWTSWIQPQHLHFLSVANLRAALESRGFTVVEVERGPAHIPVDLLGAVLMWANQLAPPKRFPWHEPATAADRLRRAVVLTTMAPFGAAAFVADRVLQPLIRTRAQRWSNVYRLLARKQP